MVSLAALQALDLETAEVEVLELRDDAIGDVCVVPSPETVENATYPAGIACSPMSMLPPLLKQECRNFWTLSPALMLPKL